jgi:hypothetical protein
MRNANVRPLGLCVCMITATAFGLDALQTPASTGARFETISITSSANERGSGSAMKTLPDGTFVMTNGEIRSIILAGSPVPVREVKGAPDWVKHRTIRHHGKATGGLLTRAQRREDAEPVD